MKTRDWLWLPAAGVAILAIGLLAACGGGDDDDDDDGGDTGFGDGTSTSSGSGSTPGSSSSSSGGGGTGSDGAYVADFCKAMVKLTDSINKISPTDLADPDKVFDVIKEPYKEFVDDLDDAKPPKDLKPYHDQLVKQFKEALKAIEEEDEAKVAQVFSQELPEPPADVEERLVKIARENGDCKAAGVTFD